MTPTAEAILAVLAPLGGAAGVAAGVRAAVAYIVRVVITEPIERADARTAAAENERDRALASAVEFKGYWKGAVAELGRARGLLEKARGRPVTVPPIAPRDTQATLVAFDVSRASSAFLDEMEIELRREAEREIPTRRDNPSPPPQAYRVDPEATPPRPTYGRARIDDARAARDPSDPRRPPRRTR
jgi:hypothetical protein